MFLRYLKRKQPYEPFFDFRKKFFQASDNEKYTWKATYEDAKVCGLHSEKTFCR